jgi:hypothetical protein
MALLIVAAFGVDRAIAGRLFKHPYDFVPAYRSFQEYSIGVKLRQFNGEQRHFDGFFVGNSRTMFGVDPPVFDSTLASNGTHFHSYNLAMPSVDVRFWPGFFSRYYAKRPPRYVFLGILPRDLDAHYTQAVQYIDEFYGSAGFRDRNMSGVSSWAEETLSHLFLLRGRISDTRLISLSDVVRGRKLDLHQIHLSNEQGWTRLLPSFYQPRPYVRARAKRLAQRHGKVPFELGSSQEQSLVRLNKWVRAGGGCLILYTTPLLYDDESWGTIEMRRGFTRAVHGIVGRIPTIQFADVGAHVQGGMGVADYGDGQHLTGPGAIRFSAALARGLKPAMNGPACRAPHPAA